MLAEWEHCPGLSRAKRMKGLTVPSGRRRAALTHPLTVSGEPEKAAIQDDHCRPHEERQSDVPPTVVYQRRTAAMMERTDRVFRAGAAQTSDSRGRQKCEARILKPLRSSAVCTSDS
jgi:hypothetical protein